MNNNKEGDNELEKNHESYNAILATILESNLGHHARFSSHFALLHC